MGTPAQRLQSDRLKFPGMLPAEVVVFKAWLVLHEAEYERFDYNVRIGAGVDPGPSVPQYWRDLALASTQLRMDAVGWNGAQPTIIEVKRRATPANIGQLLTYAAVWAVDNPNSPKPILRLVANSYQPNIVGIANTSGIALDQVDADFSILRPTTYGRKGGVNPPTGS